MRISRKKYKQRRSRRVRKYKFKGGNNSSVPIVIYSHSDVFDVLKIQLEYFTKLFSNTSQEIYLLSNIPYPDKISTNTKLKYTTIIYDDKTPYFTRLLSCITQINVPYFIITQESDILLKFDKDIINRIVNEMKEKKIDSINLQHRDNYKPEIKISETLYISKMLSDKFIFCVQPRIWNKESAIKLFSNFPNETYKSSENMAVQQYMEKNQNTYVTYSMNNFIQPFPVIRVIPEYCYIHITFNGKFLMCKKYDNINPYIEKEFDSICTLYINNSKRGN